MSSTGWKIAKYTVIGGAIIGVVGYIGGAGPTTNIVRTAAGSTGWGAGVGIAAVPVAVQGFQAGFDQTSHGKLILPGAGKPASPPKVVKVPCTPEQKKIAP